MRAVFSVLSISLIILFAFTFSNDNGTKDLSQRSTTFSSETVVVKGPALDNPLSTLSESFEGASFPPAGWIKLNPDGGTGWTSLTAGTTPLPGWNGGVATVPPGGGTKTAYATWNTGGATSNDQWLVSPQLTNVQSGDSLKFWVRKPGYCNNYMDHFDVKISTTTPVVASFTVNVLSVTSPASSPDTNWMEYKFRLGDFVSAGANIYIAFREWVLDNTNDGSAFQLDLISVTAGSTPPPVSVNKSIVFPTPGVNTNYVQIPYNAGMVGIGNNITIEGWVKLGGTTTSNTILNKGASSFDYQLGINSSSALPFFRAGSTILTGTVAVPVGVWTHVAVATTSSNAIFYINGVPGSPVSGTVTTGSSTNEMRLGRGNNDPASGKLDEVRLWNVTRTAAEISGNMCNKWIPLTSTGLKGLWHLDSTLVDSASGWNGTILGSLSFDTAMNCTATAISNVKNEVPTDYKLYQNYPNPFNPTTSIKFSIPKSSYVELKIYDILGKEVATLISDPYQAGVYVFDFNASTLASGVYFYKLVAGDFKEIKKMILLK